MKENEKNVTKKSNKLDSNTEFFRLCIVFVLFVAWLVLLIMLTKRIPLHTNIAKFVTSWVTRSILLALFAGCVGATVYLKLKNVDTSKWILTPFMGAGVFAFMCVEALFVFNNMTTSLDTSIILLLVSYAVYMLFMVYMKIAHKHK